MENLCIFKEEDQVLGNVLIENKSLIDEKHYFIKELETLITKEKKETEEAIVKFMLIYSEKEKELNKYK